MNAWLAPLVFSLSTGPVAGGSWRPPELKVEQRPPADFAELKEIAFNYLGRPYRMGGIGSPSIDCSGFTCRVFAEAGYAIPRVSRDQVRAGVPVSLDRLMPGDLLFFVAEPGDSRITHVGLYVGDRQMIHASSGRGRVVVDNIDRNWYQQRMIAARRVLASGLVGTSSTSVATSSVTPPTRPARALELVEHTGGSELPITKRLPAKLPGPSIGPELAGNNATSLAMRVAALTEQGVLGLTLVPEATLYVESWAFLASLALPIRFELKETPTIGSLDSFADWTRFVRALALGLRGADLELRFDRSGDITFAGGLLVDRLAPGSNSSGVPGLSVFRTPLSFFGAYRGEAFSVEAIAADVGQPGLYGVAASTPLIGSLEVGAAFVTDQRAGGLETRRAINALEGFATLPVYEDRSWTFDTSATAGLSRGFSRFGIGAALSTEVEYRHQARSSRAFGAKFAVGFLGGGFVESIFGPTYLASRAQHLAAVASAGGRTTIGGELSARWGRFVFAGGYTNALGSGRHQLDERLFGLVELGALPVGGNRLLDLRVAYASRGLPGQVGAVDVLHAGARVAVARWLFAELFIEKGDRVEGGLGVMVAWEP